MNLGAVARDRLDADRVDYLGSAALHVAVMAVIVLSSLFKPELPDFVTYEMDIVSPPASAPEPEPQPAAPEEIQVDQPDDPPPDEEPPTLVEDPEEQPPPTEVEETPPPPDPVVDEAAAPPDPDEEEVSGEDLRVQMEGLERDYPVYYENIIRWMTRCFRPSVRGDYRTTVYFVIHRDGSVSGVDTMVPSGNFVFDLEAREAANCAGQPGRLGPLPEDMPRDRLPVLMTMIPPGETSESTSEAASSRAPSSQLPSQGENPPR